MYAPPLQHSRDIEDVLGVAEFAAKQDSLLGLRELLGAIARSVGASHAVLRRHTKYFKETVPGSGRWEDRYHLVAYWSNSDSSEIPVRQVPYYLTQESTASSAVEIFKAFPHSEELPLVRHRAEIKLTEPDSLFAANPALQSVCSQPFRFVGGTVGTVNVFAETEFNNEQRQKLQWFARVIPHWFAEISEMANYTTLKKVREHIEQADERNLQTGDFKDFADGLCRILAEHFRCVEVSLFLEDPQSKPGTLQYAGGTVETYLRHKTVSQETNSLTWWAWEHSKPVIISDLSHYDEDEAMRRTVYPGIDWTRSVNIEDAARAVLPKGSRLPPLSFMAARLVVRKNALGVIRCCALTQAPFHFLDEDMELLKVVGTQVGEFWQNGLRRRSMERENDAWRALSRGLNVLDAEALSNLMGGEEEWASIWKKGLAVAAGCLVADQASLRLTDGSGKTEVVARRGAEWSEADRRFLDLMPDQSVIRAQEDRPPDGVSNLITVPMKAHKERYGFLDIGSSRPEGFPQEAKSMAEILGHQFALYRNLRDVIQQLAEVNRAQERVYEDLVHQLRNPVRVGGLMLAAYITELTWDSIDKRLLAVRGQLGKAYSVVNGTDLFRSLSDEKPLSLKLSDLRSDDLYKLLFEVCRDNQSVQEQGLNLRFDVEKSSLADVDKCSIRVDFDLLQQSLQNVIENAFKYCTSRSTIKVTGELESDYFVISVRNKARVEVSEEDAKIIGTKRGFRSEAALELGASGSGIGLWIVRNIMDAHHGKLEIMPDRERGDTVVRLKFPRRK